MNDDDFQYPPPGETSEPGAEPAKDDGFVKIPKAQFEQMNDRLSRNEQLFEELVRRGQGQPQPAAAANEDDEDDDFAEEDVDGDLADDLAVDGKEALKKRGFVTKKDLKPLIAKEAERIAARIVDRKQAQMLQDMELVEQYPELRNTGSAFAKRTSELYQQAVKEDPGANKNRLLKLAAREAQLEFRERSAEGKEDGGDDFSSDRARRIAAQDTGRGGRRGSRSSFDDNSDELSPLQRNLLKEMNSMSDVQVSPEQFKARAKNIKFGGMPKGGNW